MKRVVVTGIGLVTPLGVGVSENISALKAAKSGINTITMFDPHDLPTKIAGEVKGFDPELFVPKKDVKKGDRFIHLGIAAAKEALEKAGLLNGGFVPEEFGCYLCAGVGGLPEIEKVAVEYREKGFKRGISPFFIPSVIANLLSGHASIYYNLRGPNYCMVTACSSSAQGIGEAYHIIKRGDAKLMLAGGAESVISPLGIGGFNAMKALSTRNDEPHRASRPFDKDRDGFVMGEGAGVLVLEDYEHAKKRNANILAELVGYGATADAIHITKPDFAGAHTCINKALEHAQISPEQVDYINAHGTSTPAGDINESQVIEKIFGDRAVSGKCKTSSTKSMTGHLLGAAGGVESVYSIISIVEGFIPPTINLENQDAEIKIFCTPNDPIQEKVNIALSNSFGFGGTNASLIFKKI